MTLRGYNKLQDELRHLKGVERPQIIEAIAIARALGDLSENAEYHAAKDYENYAITVHALKSNSKMIGAGELSLLFEELETAAKRGDTLTIENKTFSALSDYADLAGKLEPLFGQEEIPAVGEISAEEAQQTAHELLAALDDFDDELSKKLVLKLGGYPFRSSQRDKLANAFNYIYDYQYENAEELIRELLSDLN